MKYHAEKLVWKSMFKNWMQSKIESATSVTTVTNCDPITSSWTEIFFIVKPTFSICKRLVPIMPY